MVPVDPNSPCLIGVSHRTWHPDHTGACCAPEPLAMWEEVARLAAADAGVPDAFERLERLDVVYCQSWQYDDAPGRLGAALRTSARGRYSGIGGSVPLVTLAEAARQIAAGDLQLAMVVGAEALATRRWLAKQGAQAHWSYPAAERRPLPYDVPFHPAEVAHSVFEAYLTFALFDNARRARLGTGLDEYRAAAGSELSGMTEVAAANPDAWFPRRRNRDEIVHPTRHNRMVAYPYTKLMTAIMDVDMAAALLLASHAEADALGVPPELRVYLRGWGYAEDPAYVAQRPQLWRSPAMAAAAASALRGARIGIDRVAHLDLYSCFSSSVAFAKDALRIAPSDDRTATVTGGLPYHGGPGSNYMTHSIGAMAERLRADPGSFGLVSGVGMHMTKHAYGLWSTEPPTDLGALAKSARSDTTSRADHEVEVVHITERHDGPGTIATYTVLHDRDGEARWATLVLDLPDGTRCYGRLEDPDALAAAERRELVGSTVGLEPTDDGVNLARLD